MHLIEPYYNWRLFYTAEDDPKSPFHGRVYSEFEFTTALYDHYIHPQWDEFGTPTLFMKILFVDYDRGFAIFELFGEWNDCLHNDIMFLKRNIADHFMELGVHKFFLIGENVLNFHASDDSYYEEWFEDTADGSGWVALVNFNQHVVDELSAANVDSFLLLGGQLQELNWRTKNPRDFYRIIESQISRRLPV